MGRRGFTLTELMAALALSAILLAAVYNMFITSSSVFHSQEELSTTQYRMRSAMDQVLVDLRRAGFGSSANPDADPAVCAPPGSRLQGIEIRDGVDQEAIPFANSTNPNITPDQLVLTGNFSTGRALTGKAQSANGRIALDIYPPDEAQAQLAYAVSRQPMSAGEFARVFAAPRYVSVRNTDQRIQILTVADAEYPDVILAGLTDGACATRGTNAAVWVSPVDRLRYRIERVAVDDTADPRTRLIREYLDSNGQPVDGSSIVVSDNVVDFQVWFMFRDPSSTAGSIPAKPRVWDTSSNLDLQVDGLAGSQTQYIRSAVVQLAVRTDQEHTEMKHRPRVGTAGRLLTFDLDGIDDNGSAPVVMLSAEVEIPNFGLRDLSSSGLGQN